MSLSYKQTRTAAYIGYFIQAIVNNLSPLFFVFYERDLSMRYTELSFIVLINFATQLLIDISSAFFVDVIGYRRCICGAHIASFLGLVMLPVLPLVMPAFAGIGIATVCMAVGSGLIEVMISPIVESLPGDQKAGQMCLLHSFYCWGVVGVSALTTVLLTAAGSWRVIPFIWALVPLGNFFFFRKVPIIEPPRAEKYNVRNLLRNKKFLMMMAVMACGGAAELSMSQWASVFAERSLGLPKALGDLLGPCGFALFMGLGRVVYALWGNRFHIRKALTACAVLCLFCYLTVAMARLPVFGMIGCMLCGLSVSLMWPGCLSLAAEQISGSTKVFALLAMSGDIGCTAGPWLVGIIAAWSGGTGLYLGGLRLGLLAGALFPLCMIVSLFLTEERK